jgi:hypothetical protein
LDLLSREVPASSLVVAIDPGKAFNRVWLTTGERGLIGEPISLPVLKACRTTARNQPADPQRPPKRTTRRFTQIPRSRTAAIRHDPHST